MLEDFLKSRRQGLSHNTLLFYQRCIGKAIGIELTSDGIDRFLASLSCGNGKFSYFRAIRALCNWMVKNDILPDNPIKRIDTPKPSRQILPSLTHQEVNYLVEFVDCFRDKAIISLFADSGMRLTELTNIK
jgi:site-specific recombinase XerC